MNGFSVYYYQRDSKKSSIKIAWFLSLTDAEKYLDNMLEYFFTIPNKTELFIIDETQHLKIQSEFNYDPNAT